MKHTTQIISELNHISLLKSSGPYVSLSYVFSTAPRALCLSLSLSRPLILSFFYFFSLTSVDDTEPLPFFLFSSTQRLSPEFPFFLAFNHLPLGEILFFAQSALLSRSEPVGSPTPPVLSLAELLPGDTLSGRIRPRWPRSCHHCHSTSPLPSLLLAKAPIDAFTSSAHGLC
jgi:hypothetical protein